MGTKILHIEIQFGLFRGFHIVMYYRGLTAWSIMSGSGRRLMRR